jgi:hypothetical protein
VVWIGNDRIAAGDWFGKVIGWTRSSTGDFAQSQTWNTGGQIIGMVVSPDGTKLAAGAAAGTGEGFEFLPL